MVDELNPYLRGWHGYFGFCQTPSVLMDLDSWIRRKLRCVVWKQWKRGRTRYKELCRRGVNEALAAKTAGNPHGPWRLSHSAGLCIAFPNAYFDGIGLFRLAVGR
jgi:RNA-directed DNA polymerase